MNAAVPAQGTQAHAVVASPNKPRPGDPFALAVADTLRRIEINYDREGSGPGSRFEGLLLEDVQARAVLAMTAARQAEAAAVPPAAAQRLVHTGHAVFAEPPPELPPGYVLPPAALIPPAAPQPGEDLPARQPATVITAFGWEQQAVTLTRTADGLEADGSYAGASRARVRASTLRECAAQIRALS